jgi:hypothetical protein
MTREIAFVCAFGLSACATTQRPAPIPASVSSYCSNDLWRSAPIVLGAETIADVEPLYATLSSHGSWLSRLRGATIRFRPVAGLTEDALEALIWCHRDAVAKGLVPTLASDPYALPEDRMSVKIERDGAGLVAKLSCDDIDDAKAVLARSCMMGCSARNQN